MRTIDEPPQDIICFYNQIFIPAMKDQLMRICSGAAGTATAGPSPGTCASPRFSEAKGAHSPQKVSGKSDFYMSQPRTPSHMTPRTRTLYAFGDTPAEKLPGAEKLQHINQQLNCGPVSDSAAMHALRQLRGSSPLRPGLVPAPSAQSSDSSRKRVAPEAERGGGIARRQLQRRLLEQAGTRSSVSSQGSASSEPAQCEENEQSED